MADQALLSAASLRGFTVLFGGSFNPPHMGHQLACLYLLEGLRADRVIVAPCGRHAFGKHLRPFSERLALCRAMTAGLGPRCLTSDVEGRDTEPSRTLRTLRHLAAQEPKTRWAFVVGADLVAELPRWQGFDELISLALPVVLLRAGYPDPNRLDLAALGPEVVVAPLGLPEISSTVLRERLSEGKSILGLVPRGVADLLA